MSYQSNAPGTPLSPFELSIINDLANIGTPGQMIIVDPLGTGLIYVNNTGGSPAGSSGEVQFNSTGAFGALNGSVVSGNDLKLTDSVFNLDGQTIFSRLQFTGLAVDASTDTGGIEEVLNHNDNAGNKQLVVRDINGTLGASTGFRYLVGTTYIAGIDAVDNDGNTIRAINVGNNTSGMSVGGEGHAYNVTLPAQLTVYGNGSKDLLQLWDSTGGSSKFTVDNSGNLIAVGSLTASAFVKTGGTSSEFLKADGSVDSTSYGTGTVTSVGLSSSGSLTIGSSPVTSSGTITANLNLANANTWTAQQTFNTVSSIFGVGIITPKIYPASNSTTAIQFLKADGTTNILNIDTTNSRVGIGTTAPATPLHVVGQGYFSTSAAFGASSGVISDTGGIFSNGLSVAGLVIRGSDNYTSSSFTFKTDGAYAIQTGGSNTRISITSGGLVGMGIGTAVARLHLVSTTEQFRVGYDSSNYYSTTVSSTGGVTFDAVGAGASFTFSDNVIMADSKDFQFNTTTGTKLGTSASQKLSLWNATPIVQPTTSVGDSTLVSNGGTTLTDTDTFDGYTLKQIVKALRNIGALA